MVLIAHVLQVYKELLIIYVVVDDSLSYKVTFITNSVSSWLLMILSPTSFHFFARL